jgi:Arc/MetJ-type ribon-helix-helix transcriptional regulator
MASERVTVTLPAEMVEEIDRAESNRSRFVLDAVRHELQRRRRQELRRSLREPHSETLELAEAGLDEWAGSLSRSAEAGLVDSRGGRAIRWDPEVGWVEVKK